MSLLDTGDGPVRLAVVDDHLAVLKGYTQLISAMDGYEVTMEVQDARQLDLTLPVEERPHIALVDMNMPHQDGVATIRLLRQHWPETRVLGLSFETTAETVSNALEAGACGFITKDMAERDLLDGLESTRRRGHYHNDRLMRAVLAEKATGGTKLVDPLLNDQERRLLDVVCMADEPTWLMVADRLGVLPCTVDKQRESLYKKLKVKSKAGAVTWGQKRGYGKGLYGPGPATAT
jgi:DNA-binding NarL/FixJ family response regulator